MLIMTVFDRKSEGLSGRNARKLPFLGYAKHTSSNFPDLQTFLKALEKAVVEEFEDRKLISTADQS
jgi:hypothetical protein